MFQLAADTAPSHKDVVIAMVGAAAALAGLVLVFVGVLLTTRETLRGHVKDATLSRFATASWAGLGIFLFSLLSMVAGTTWLATNGGENFYATTLAIFFADVLALAVTAIAATRVLLK